MELQEFIARSLEAIVTGVADAQAVANECGATVNAGRTKGRRRLSTGETTSISIAPLQTVEFDVAVTVSEGSHSKGGIGVFAGPLALGSQGASDAGRQSVSRIKFSVPVRFPVAPRPAREEPAT